MGTYYLSSEAGFAAAHTLDGVDKCSQLHGHNWKVRLTIEVPEDALDERGMGVDFRDIEGIARACTEDFEHQYLNDLPEFADAQPTAEFLARLVADRAAARLADGTPGATLHEVSVWEMPEYRVVYKP